jgi:hypothetical protein
MKMPEVQQVIRAARALPEDGRVPYAFEKRIMTLIGTRKPADIWSIWSHTMWRAALACVAITVVMGAFSELRDEPSELFAADLEQTVMAPISSEETW